MRHATFKSLVKIDMDRVTALDLVFTNRHSKIMPHISRINLVNLDMVVNKLNVHI